MKICVCIDKSNGMMFMGKRQSQDRVQREKLQEIVGDNKLWMSSYSGKLFEPSENICIDDDFPSKAGEDDYCFLEDIMVDFDDVSSVILYKWNRAYPGDVTFDCYLKDFKKISKRDFEGSSHEKITEEVYERKAAK